MDWKNIVGQDDLISKLKYSIDKGRVPHAQLFVGEEGYGVLPLVLAYIQEIMCRENPKSISKIEHLNHIDVHFSFPTFSGSNDDFTSAWREMILENPYASLSDFEEILQGKNKKFNIPVEEVDRWINKLTLKSYEGGTKILVVWRADLISVPSANKFLKLLEEPPKQTVIFLLANNVDSILPTILSRCQITQVPRIDENAMTHYLEKIGISHDLIPDVVHQSQGNLEKAIKIINENKTDEKYEELFIDWVRNAFMAKKDPRVLNDLIIWSRNISDWDKEKQLSFLNYCLEIFRLALLQNYGNTQMVYKKLQKNDFKWNKFSEYIQGANIELIMNEINEADLHIRRNGNSKIVWTDLGIKLIRHIHKNY